MKGIKTSPPGIALGKVFVYKEPEINVVKENTNNVEEELYRLDKAMEQGIQEIDRLYKRTLDK